MEQYNRKSIFSKLKGYCTFAKEHDYIEVTEWKNGEGFDVDINSSNNTRFQITHGEFKSLKKMIKKLESEY